MPNSQIYASSVIWPASNNPVASAVAASIVQNLRDDHLVCKSFITMLPF